jgi:L-2,4-diaminobutyrate transaminase
MNPAQAAARLAALDRASILHPATNARDFAAGKAPQTVIDSGAGIRIRDVDGRELIDAFAGLYCVNIGYGRTEVADAIARQRTNWPTTTTMPATPLRS